MTVYLDDYIIEANLAGSTWTDITSDVIIEAISADWGITDNTAVDLVADAGSMTFTLNNIGDEYIPGHASATAGWAINTPVRLKCTYEGVPYHFRFYVDTLDVTSEEFNRKKIRVSCVDYIEFMARTPLIGQAAVASQRADQGLTTLVAGMQTAPQATSYQTGQETFNTIFTATTPSTRIYGETAKLVKSEFGYWYETKDSVNGETLVFEDRHLRSGLKTLDQVQSNTGDVLLLETGDKLLLETGDNLLLSQTEDAVFDNTMSRVDIQYGKDIVNHFKAIANPTTVTAGASTLWELGEPIEIGRGQVLVFRANYRDPAGGTQINCLTTDATNTTHSMRPNSDGTGADLDANLTVSASFGAESVEFTLTNKYSGTGYVTALTATGTGLLIYSSVFKETESAASKLAYDLRPQSINQAYQQTPDLGILKGASIVEAEKNPRVDLQKITFSANRSTQLMHTFLDIGVGSLAHIKEDDTEIDGYYYIQGKEFQIALGGIITFSWIVRGVNSLISGGLTPVALEIGGSGTNQGIDFGVAPYIETEKARTFSAWVYFNNGTGVQSIVHNSSNNNGVVFVSNSGKLRFTSQKLGAVGAPTGGQWTADDAHATGSWILVGVTYDQSSDPTSAPIFYIDGSSVALTEDTGPTAPYLATPGVPLTIGGIFTTDVGNNPTVTWELDGKIADVRVYSSVLTSGNMTTLYNAGDPDSSLLTTNLLFQGPCVRTVDYAGLLDTVLTAADKLTDNMFGIVGAPEGGETLRVFP